MTDKNYWHNKGEQDEKEDKYSPPGPPLFMELIGGLSDYDIKNKKQYSAGRSNARDQKKKS